MKIKQFIENKKEVISLTDFLNHAKKAGHDVNSNLEHWIKEYSAFINEYEKRCNQKSI